MVLVVESCVVYRVGLNLSSTVTSGSYELQHTHTKYRE